MQPERANEKGGTGGLREALQTAERALSNARDGLDFGLGAVRQLEKDTSPVPVTERAKRADGYLRRARKAHDEVRAALASAQPPAPALSDEQRLRLMQIVAALELESVTSDDWWDCAAHDLRTLASQEQGEAEGCPKLSIEEATAVVSAAFSEDHDSASLDRAIKRLGDWVDAQLAAEESWCDGSGSIQVEVERIEPDCCGNTTSSGECRGDCAVPRQVQDIDVAPCPGCPRCRPPEHPERPEVPEGVERFYLVRCGECGFLGGPELGHCAKCGYDGLDPSSEGIEMMRVDDARKQIAEKIAPAIRKQERERVREEDPKFTAFTAALLAELVALREAVATHLIYLDEEIVGGLRDGRHTREVAANIGQHQSRNLRRAVEITGKLNERDGTAGSSVRLPATSTSPVSFFDTATQDEIRRHYAALDSLEDSDE